MLIDGAGWHVANDLEVPPNITLVPLPPYSPELNAIERLWQHMRDTLLSHRLFTDLSHHRRLLHNLEYSDQAAGTHPINMRIPMGGAGQYFLNLVLSVICAFVRTPWRSPRATQSQRHSLR